MASNTLNLVSKAQEIQSKLPCMDYTLGKGLLQPFNNTNSGSRKIMQGVQKEQTIQIVNAEPPLIETGYENQFGEYSSSYVVSDQNYTCIRKVFKNPQYYYMIAYDTTNQVLHCFRRKSYEHLTENYGYSINNEYLDTLGPNGTIKKGDVIFKSESMDQYNNRCDGINITTAYIACALTTEDPIVLSESAAKRFTSPFFSKIQVIINDNDILLNLYGVGNEYKSFPDIGEKVKDGILCAVRRERKDDEALYAQSYDMLRQLTMSDECLISKGNGTVIDIDVYCNNPDKINSIYNSQVAKYYKRQMEFYQGIVDTVESFMHTHTEAKMSYDMSKLYTMCRDAINGVPFIKDKVFNNIVMEVVVKEDKPLRVGDKITDRYGGKGVISAIFPDNLMPMYQRYGKWYSVDAIYNSSTVVDRENPGQLFETELTFIASKILDRINKYWESLAPIYADTTMEKAVTYAEELIYKYLNIVSPNEAASYHNLIRTETLESRYMFVVSCLEIDGIVTVVRPISDNMRLDVLKTLYNTFDWITQDDIYILQRCSNGQYRRIMARRPLVVGKKYIYRLKQIAEEKFSAVSLASTNIKSENTKTKANKLHKSPIPKTPVRMGSMEIGNLCHADVGQVVSAIMLLSSSPGARRLHEELLTGDPFDINIRLDNEVTSRSAEIVNAYLKTMGLRLVFKKSPKKFLKAVIMNPVYVLPQEPKKLIEPVLTAPYYVNAKEVEALSKKLGKVISKQADAIEAIEIIPEEERDNSKYVKWKKGQDLISLVLKLARKSSSKEELEKKISNYSLAEKEKIHPVKICPVKVFGQRRDEGNNEQ